MTQGGRTGGVDEQASDQGRVEASYPQLGVEGECGSAKTFQRKRGQPQQDPQSCPVGERHLLHPFHQTAIEAPTSFK